MLVLSRRTAESVVAGDLNRFGPMLTVTVLEINGGSVSLGFEAGDDVLIHRWEVWRRVLARPSPDRVTEGPAMPEEEMDRWGDDGGRMSQ